MNQVAGSFQQNTSFMREAFLPKSCRYLYWRRLVSVNLRDTQGVLNDMDVTQTLLETVCGSSVAGISATERTG